LNRIVSWFPDRIEYEADQRHAEIITKMAGLESNSRPITTTGDRTREGDETELGATDTTKYRAIVARANYMSQDRSDVKFAVKELSRKMAKPRIKDWELMKKLARYLKGVPRLVQVFKEQEMPKYINTWCDSDYAGCLETRKSTTGRIVMFGNHAIKHWPSTQSLISISSGEAEYYGCVRAASHGLGIKSLLADLGVTEKRLRVKNDASVAKSLAARRGLGGIRHIEVNQLY
jgi:hypothetical protein